MLSKRDALPALASKAFATMRDPSALASALSAVDGGQFDITATQFLYALSKNSTRTCLVKVRAPPSTPRVSGARRMRRHACFRLKLTPVAPVPSQVGKLSVGDDGAEQLRMNGHEVYAAFSPETGKVQIISWESASCIVL